MDNENENLEYIVDFATDMYELLSDNSDNFEDAKFLIRVRDLVKKYFSGIE